MLVPNFRVSSPSVELSTNQASEQRPASSAKEARCWQIVAERIAVGTHDGLESGRALIGQFALQPGPAVTALLDRSPPRPGASPQNRQRLNAMVQAAIVEIDCLVSHVSSGPQSE